MTDRRLSHWGWGWEDRFPSPDERQNLAAMVAAMSGLDAPPTPREPVALDDADMPEPAELDLPAALEAIASRDRRERASHTWGRAWPDIYRGFTGDFSVAPDLVLRPRSEDDVVAAIEWASNDNVALIPFGGGTSVVGGTEPRIDGDYAGVASLDMRAMDEVLEIDDTSRLALVEAGATGPRLEEQLAPHGLSLRHYPQSFEFSTVGGWIATRSGGHFATLYTHIDERVAAVRMATPTGIYDSRTLPGSGAGPSPDRSLAIGSEGILGVITRAWLRVFARPTHKAKASVRFADFDDAVAAAREVAQSGLFPANCRVLDAREAMLFGVSMTGDAILLLGFESADHPVDSAMKRALEIATSHGGRPSESDRAGSTDPSDPSDGSDAAGPAAPTNADRQSPDADGSGHGPASASDSERGGATSDTGGDHASWRAAFIDAPYLVNTMVSLGIIADTFETACTWSDFPALHAAVVKNVRAVMKERCGRGLLTCRFTHVYPDGPAPYFTFVAPAPEGRELETWRAIKRTASDTLLEHGATITHHHAVGRTHRPWYQRQVPEPYLRALRATKETLDPGAVLNPGVLVGERDGTAPSADTDPDTAPDSV